MPTNRHRIQITETPEIEHAIDVAARQWPGESRSKLLLRVIHAGAASLKQDRTEIVRRRREAIRASSGQYADAFSENYLEELREDSHT